MWSVTGDDEGYGCMAYLVVDTVLADDAEQLVGAVVLAAEVLRVAAVDLGHGLDWVTRVGAGDVGVVLVLVAAAQDPLGKRLLVQGRPDVGAVRGTGKDGLVVGVGDGDLVVDLDRLSAVVVVASLVVEADAERVTAATAVLVLIHALAVRVDTGRAVDGCRAGPEDREYGSDEPAVGGSSLGRVVKEVHGTASSVPDGEIGHIVDKAPVDALEEVVVHVAPGCVGR